MQVDNEDLTRRLNAMLETIKVERLHSCDGCGASMPDPDECVCAWCKLTAKQRECLKAARTSDISGISTWDYGSTTINVLRTKGFLSATMSRCFITPEGAAVIP